MYSLENQIILVAGGAGVVGSGIVKKCLKEGAIVIVPSRSQSRLIQLKEEVEKVNVDWIEKLDTIFQESYDLDCEKAVEDTRSEILKKYGRIDYVVSSLGCWFEKSYPTETSISEFRQVLDSFLTSNLIYAKYFLNHAKNYTIITDILGDFVIQGKSGLVTCAACGLFGLVKAFRKEVEEREWKVLLNELRIAAYIKKPNEVDANNSMEFSSDIIGDYMVKILQSNRGGMIYTFRNENDCQEMTTM